MKTLAAEETGAQLAVEGDVQLGAHRRAEEGLLLDEDPAADRPQVQRDHLAGVGGGESNLPPAAAVVGEVGQEQRLAGQSPFAGRLEPAPGALVGLGSVAHLGLEPDVPLDVHHRARLGDDRLLRVELDLDELEIVSMYLIVDFVASHDGLQMDDGTGAE